MFFENIKIKVHTTDSQDFIDINEIKALINSKTIHPSITNAFIFGCLTGLGENDLKDLEWFNFELIGGDYFIKLNRNNEIYKLKISRMAMNFIGKPLKVRGKVFFKLKSTYYTNLKLKEWLNSCNIFKKLTFKSCKYTFAANYLSKSEGFTELSNNSNPSFCELMRILNHKQEYHTKIFVRRINLDRLII